MIKRICTLILASMVIVSVTTCTKKKNLSPFSSDGCSLFPDASLMTQTDWCSCCFLHDIAYWQGGTTAQRKWADMELKQCVEQKTGNPALANLMYEGVRLGGSPYFYNWYRWGYGWGYERKYQALTAAEKNSVELLLKQYHASKQKKICKG